MFKALIREIVALSHAMGIEFAEDLVERNLKILAALSPEATTSMQRRAPMFLRLQTRKIRPADRSISMAAAMSNRPSSRSPKITPRGFLHSSTPRRS